MKIMIHKYRRESEKSAGLVALKRLIFMLILSGGLVLPGVMNAQVQLPAIPSNTQLSNSFDYDSEYIYQVNLSGSYLEDGAIIAYVDGKIRGAQTASVLFTPTNTMVYKVRLFSNSTSGEVITFKYFDVNGNKVYDITETQTFQADNVPDYNSPQTLNAYCGGVGKVGTLVPEDNTQDLDNSVSLYWEPASNATHYSVFLWKDGDFQPITAYRSNIYGTSSYASSLEYGATYHWYVESLNQCGSDVCVTQSFTVRDLPDLIVTSFTAPDTVISSSPFDVEFTVKNLGLGDTRTGHSWYNAVYASTDNSFSGDDKLIGKVAFSRVLQSDSSYTQTVSVALPAEYAGDYHLFVKADVYNNVPESDNDNNLNQQLLPIEVKAKPLPDILVENIASTQTSYDPGDTITVSWDVRNIGGADAIGGWTERVSIVSLSGIKVNLAGRPDFSVPLAQNATQERGFDFVIPEILNFSGEAYIEVQLYPSTGIVELPGNEVNNKAASVNRISLSNKLYLTIPTAEVKEGYSGAVRCYVARSGNTTNELTVNLSASVEGVINLPSAVTIPSRSSSGMFDITPIDNSILDGTRNVTVSTSAAGFSPISKDIAVLDDEVPSLSLTLDADTLQEGDAINITISRDLIIAGSTVVYLTTDKSEQWTFPTTVIIPANQNSVQAEVVVVDNTLPELSQTAKLMISSAGLVTTEKSVVIADDDIPAIEMVLANDTVAESAGPYATEGIISRKEPGTCSVRIDFRASDPNAIFFPASITLEADEMSKKFNVGVVDNTQVDGFRDISISGAIYIASCSCSATGESGGVVVKTLTIVDNDGPSFSLTVDRPSLKEGLDSAGTLSIFRNTDTTSALEITLSTNDTTELELPATVTIPAGESTVQVAIKTKDDSQEDGNQMVTMKAESAGFNPGVVWVYVTDVNKADLSMTDIELAKDSVVAGDYLRVQLQVINNGYGTAASGVKVNFYLSENNILDDNDTLIFVSELAEPVQIGATLPFVEILPIPNLTGKYNVIAKINPEFEISELVYVNNDALSSILTILPEYNGTAQPGIHVLSEAAPVTITGSAVMADGTPVPNADLDVYIILDNVRRVLNVTTDDNGDYSTVFEPFGYETGHFIVGSCYPGQDMNDEQDSFDILGMERTSKEYFIWNIKKDVPISGTIEIRNRSDVGLNSVSLWSDKFPDGCKLTIDTIAKLAGGATAELHYTVEGLELSTGRNYIEFPLKASSDEGVSFEFTVYYYCQAVESHLESNPASINTTMTKGKIRYYDVQIFNNGAGETGPLNVELPDVSFMTLVTPDSIASVASGDTAVITLMLNAGDDIPLNLSLKGNFVVHVPYGDDLSVPYSMESVSEDKGNLRIDVVDEYTYFTDSAPHVSTAHVVLRHPYTGAIVAEGFTGDDGIFEVDSIAEGNYTLTVEAEKHDGYRSNIVIDPGRTNSKTVFLDYQAITYTWDVIPVDIEDHYQVDLIMEFETNVPAPVVVMEMPDVMPELTGDETYTFFVTLTNKGLITAEDIELNFPTDDPEYEWVFNFPKTDLIAQQAIQVPVTMRVRTTAPQPEPGIAVNDWSNLKSSQDIKSSGSCTDYAVTIYGFECGADMHWHQGAALFSFSGRVCTGSGGGYYGGGGWSGGGLGGGSGSSSVGSSTGTVTSSNDCDPCLNTTLLTIMGCAGGGVGGVIACGSSMADGSFTISDGIGCIPGPIGCIWSIIGTIEVCYNQYSNGAGSAYQLKSAFSNVQQNGVLEDNVPPILRQYITDLKHAEAYDSIARLYYTEYFGVIYSDYRESFSDFIGNVDSVMSNKLEFSNADIIRIKAAMAGTDILDGEIDAHTTRWNSTMEAWGQNIFSPTAAYSNIVDHALIDGYLAQMDGERQYAESREYSSVYEMRVDAYALLKEAIDDKSSSVCASVSIKISQTVVMTREAFEGTLTIFNGNETGSMQNIQMNIEIKDEDGVLSNDLFQIETKALDILTGIDGTGVLGSEEKGSATILFIPEKGAAPTVPKSYSFGGSFSYLDPYTGLTVTKDLMPVTLQVNPSPDLFLHYFMQRNILGDDALTLDVIEPIVPAELAVMIVNNGFGAANRVRIESAQPEIIDNEKGLSIHFELIGSNLNGEERQLGLTNINFGDIAPKSSAVGQWWFTSDLLGHFIKYETNVTHLDSYGNPDLSLISGATLHELIRSIRVYGGTDDGINDFLVNEVQDLKEQPDAIYMSQGDVVLDVFGVDAAAFEGSMSTNTLKVVTSKRGWNNLELPDPGHGNYEIVSITRNWDGKVIPTDNAWLTFVTLPDGKEPVYEDIFHFVDNIEEVGDHEYTVVWKFLTNRAVAVELISGVPSSVVSQPVTSLNVKFNKPIDPSTFSYEDMTLRFQGGDDIMSSAVVITKVDSVNYNLDLSALTTGNGFYNLVVQAAEISDLNGNNGEVGKQVTWTQFLSVPAVEEFIGITQDSLITSSFDYIMVKFNLPLDENTVTSDKFILERDGVVISNALTITKMDVESKLFKLSGMSSLMTSDGEYSLTVDLFNIATLDGEKGLIQQSVSWSMDTTPPELSGFTPDSDSGFDGHHFTGFAIEFSEKVSGLDVSNVELWKDGIQQPLSQLHFDYMGNNIWYLSQFRLLTYYEGSYTLRVNMADVFDEAGLAGSGVQEYNWGVNRSAPLQVQNLRILPDLGFSNSDNVTSETSLQVVMDVVDDNVDVEVYYNNFGTLILLNDTMNVMSGEISVPIDITYAGNITLEVHVLNSAGNYSTSQLNIVVDRTAFNAEWDDVSGGTYEVHPASINLMVTNRLLESSPDVSLLKLEHNGIEIPLAGNVTISQVSDTVYTVSGFDNLAAENGSYTLSADLTGLHKYNSGLGGTHKASVTWTIDRSNDAPVAVAGNNFYVEAGHKYGLDGSASTDPEDDNITYHWFAPDGFTLDDEYSMTPSFTAPANLDSAEVYTFVLLVSDGNLTSTDKVNVFYSVASNIELEVATDNIILYPNPCTTQFTVYIDETFIESIKLVDMSGAVLLTKEWTGDNEQSIKIGTLPKGVYIVQIKTDEKTINRKLLVK